MLGNTAGGIERGTLEYRHQTYAWPSKSCFKLSNTIYKCMCVTLCCPHCTGDACQWRCWCEHASRVRHVCCPLCLLSRITHVITLISTRPRSAASQCPASIPTIMFTSAVGPETWDHPATIIHVTAAFLYAILYSELCAY